MHVTNNLLTKQTLNLLAYQCIFYHKYNLDYSVEH